MEVDSPNHPAPTTVLPSDVTAAPPPPSPSPVSPSPGKDVPGGHPARARRSKRARPATAEDGAGPAAAPRRKRRGTREPCAAAAAALAPASPVKRSVRRARGVGREEKGKEVVEDAAGKVRRRKTTGNAQASKASLVSLKEKGSSLAIVPYPTTKLTRGANNERQNGCEGLWEMVTDLVMWNNVARSAFWFGSGSMVFISSSLSRDIELSPISVGCQFGVVMLGLAFFKDSVFQRQQGEPPRQFQLTEEDVRHAARAVLPIVNSIISMAQSVFSGDASMTLKVLPLLLFGAKFGHLLTTWRLLATGFFGCFTLPKLYSYYSNQVHTKAKGLKDRILNAWKSCPRKKLVLAVAVTTCWNLLSVKTRILAAFFCLATLRYYYQYCQMNGSSQRGINRTHGEDQSMATED